MTAGATTLIVSLGILREPEQLVVLMVAVALLVVQAFAINRLAELPTPAGRRPAPAEIHSTGSWRQRDGTFGHPERDFRPSRAAPIFFKLFLEKRARAQEVEMALPAEVKGHQLVWVDVPGGRTRAIRVVADGDRLVCFGDDGLSGVPEGTGLFASVRGLACGPLEKYFRVRVRQLAPDDVSLSQVADLLGNTPLGRTTGEIGAALEAHRSSRRLVALEG